MSDVKHLNPLPSTGAPAESGPKHPVCSFSMADVRGKRITARRAVARGTLFAGATAFPAIAERKLPKGDALAMAEIAGLQGAKLASQLMPLCHPLLLELVRVHCELRPATHAVDVYCEVATHSRTGVEMEALAGVNAALLTIYDLTKPVEPALSIAGVRLLFKEGGKKGLWLHPEGMSADENAHFKPRSAHGLHGICAAVITLSDRAASGVYDDRSGAQLDEMLERDGAHLLPRVVIADSAQHLKAQLEQAIGAGAKLVFTTGGTGLGPRDITPQALAGLGGIEVTGLGELLRHEGATHTSMSWLSRSNAMLWNNTLIIALPGSSKAVAEGWAILQPLLAHALAMIRGEGH